MANIQIKLFVLVAAINIKIQKNILAIIPTVAYCKTSKIFMTVYLAYTCTHVEYDMQMQSTSVSYKKLKLHVAIYKLCVCICIHV